MTQIVGFYDFLLAAVEVQGDERFIPRRSEIISVCAWTAAVCCSDEMLLLAFDFVNELDLFA